MGFVIAKKEFIDIDVCINVPEDNGKTTKGSLKVTYKRPTTQDVKEFQELVNAEGYEPETVLREWIIDINGAKNEDGSNANYSEELLEVLLDYPYVRTALHTGLLECMYGKDAIKAAKAKN